VIHRLWKQGKTGKKRVFSWKKKRMIPGGDRKKRFFFFRSPGGKEGISSSGMEY